MICLARHQRTAWAVWRRQEKESGASGRPILVRSMVCEGGPRVSNAMVLMETRAAPRAGMAGPLTRNLWRPDDAGFWAERMEAEGKVGETRGPEVHADCLW